MSSEATRTCWRCGGHLEILPESDETIRFFCCGACLRNYAQKSGKGLTDRWMSPLSIALYGTQFYEQPARRAGWHADQLLAERDAAWIEILLEDIDSELETPEQRVRDILDCRPSEEECRRFLSELAVHLRAHTRDDDNE